MSGTAGDFANFITLNGSNNNDQSVDFEVTFQVNSSQPGGAFCGGGTNYGIAIGKLGVSQFSTNTIQAFLEGEQGPTDSIAILSNGAQVAGSSAPNNPTCLAPGDIVRLVYSQRVNIVTVIYDNYTQGTHNSTAFADSFNAGTHALAIPNSSKFAVWSVGGAYTILNMRVISRQTPYPRVAFLGDSKTLGYNSGTETQRFASSFKAYGPTAVFAGQGDVTGDMLADLPYILQSPPQYAVLCIGYNDAGYGVPSGTWQANYTAIVTQLKAAGVHVIHMLSIPSNAGVNVTALNAWISSTFSADNIVDPSVGWSNSLYLSSDNVHPNALGHAFVASSILSDNYIPLPISAAPEFMVTSSSADYPAAVPFIPQQITITDDSSGVVATTCATSPWSGSCTSARGVLKVVAGGSFAPGIFATIGSGSVPLVCLASQLGGPPVASVGSTPTTNGWYLSAGGSMASQTFYVTYFCQP